MKKYIYLAISAILVLALASCSGKTAAADFQVQDAMDDMLAAAPIDDPLTLSEGDMLDFFGIQADSMEQFAAVTCANGISAQEIVLVKAKDEDSAKTVEEKLQNRLDSRKAEAENYLPDQFAIMDQCQVKRDGVYVRLIISPEEEALAEIYQGYLDGK